VHIQSRSALTSIKEQNENWFCLMYILFFYKLNSCEREKRAKSSKMVSQCHFNTLAANKKIKTNKNYNKKTILLKLYAQRAKTCSRKWLISAAQYRNDVKIKDIYKYVCC
jgi:hypothetical protein